MSAWGIAAAIMLGWMGFRAYLSYRHAQAMIDEATNLDTR